MGPNERIKPLIITTTVYNVTQGRVTRICLLFVITVPYQTRFVILEEIKRVFAKLQSRNKHDRRTAAPSYRDRLVDAPHSYAARQLVYFSTIRRV